MAKKSAPLKDIPTTPVTVSGKSKTASKATSAAASKAATSALKGDKMPKSPAAKAKKTVVSESESVAIPKAAKKSRKQTPATAKAAAQADISATVATPATPTAKKNKTTEKIKPTKVTSKGKPVPAEVVAKLSAKKKKSTEPEIADTLTIDTPIADTPIADIPVTMIPSAESANVKTMTEPVDTHVVAKSAVKKTRIARAAIPISIESIAGHDLTESPMESVAETTQAAAETPVQAPPEDMTDAAEAFTFLSDVEPIELHLERGAILYTAGEDCTRAYFVKKGSFSAVIPNRNGNGIVLYTVNAGEVCVLSVAAATALEKHRVTAVLLESTDILAVPTEKLTALLDTNGEARATIYSQMAQRLTEALSLLEEVGFHHKDVRLATALSKKVTWDNLIWPGTIGELADSTDTTITVTKLILQEFQRLGLVTLEQDVITVVDRAALIRKSME